MLTLKDWMDFYDLSENEIAAIERFAHTGVVEAFVLGEQADHDSHTCRKIIKYLCEYYDEVSHQGDETEIHNVASSIKHFTDTHQQYLY